MAEQRSLGRVMNPCQTESHAECKAKFEQLPHDSQAYYKINSEASASAARMGRGKVAAGGLTASMF